MATPKTTKLRRPQVPVVAQPADPPFETTVEDRGAWDVSLNRLRLAGILRSQGVLVDPTQIITNAGSTTNTLTDSFTQPPTLVFGIFDRGYQLLNSGIFDNVIDVELDEVPFRLMELQLVDVETLQLTFYHRIVAVLMSQTGPLSASRAQMTRAQFIELMLSEILYEVPDLEYVCPEISDVQPVGSTKRSGRHLKRKRLASKKTRPVPSGGSGNTNPSSDGGGGTGGFGVTSLRIRGWDGGTVTLTPEQLHNAALVLETCAQLNAGAKATLAMCEACIVESPNFSNPAGGDGASQGILQWGGDGHPPPWATDVVQSVTHSLQDPGATGAGGMISLVRNHPEWSAGHCAQVEQGSAYGSRYDMAQSGAQTVIGAWTKGGGATSGAAASGSGKATYNFTRGQSGQREDSWTCGQRLAQEVQWRLFVTGRRTVWFVTDRDLLLTLPTRLQLDPANEGLGQLTFDREVGQRTYVKHGTRQPKLSQGQVNARVGLWQCQPGDPVAITGYGVDDLDWLLTEVDRDLFDRTATLYFSGPQQALPEPAASSSGGGGGGGGTPDIGSGNPIDRVYAAATLIGKKNLPYIYGGGHTSWAADATAAGLDCSGSVSYALYLAGLMKGFPAPIASGGFSSWMAPGRGTPMTVWYSAGHVFIEFYGRPAKRFDTVGGSGPGLRYTAPVEALSSFQARHVPGF